MLTTTVKPTNAQPTPKQSTLAPQPTIAKQPSYKFTYTLEMVKEEARHLVAQGYVSRQQPIYVLCQYIPAREWEHVELELECGGFLLRDRMVDLLGREDWSND